MLNPSGSIWLRAVRFPRFKGGIDRRTFTAFPPCFLLKLSICALLHPKEFLCLCPLSPAAILFQFSFVHYRRVFSPFPLLEPVKMGSINVLDTIVSLPDNPKAWSCSSLPATTNRKPITQQHIPDLHDILKKTDDGSIMLVPGDDGYEESLRRWSRAAEKRAVSAVFTFPSRSAKCLGGQLGPANHSML
jgi:hypothetical protein